jgi:hypothetical protein
MKSRLVADQDISDRFPPAAASRSIHSDSPSVSSQFKRLQANLTVVFRFLTTNRHTETAFSALGYCEHFGHKETGK